MLDRKVAEEIAALAAAHWRDRVNSHDFAGLAAGKEIGHRIADLVDEETTALIADNYEVRFETDRQGRRRARSMGDVWVAGNGIFNPINVKAGEAGKNGQPNMVSLKKLLSALLRRQIDSYYLLIVKMTLTEPRSVKVYFADILKYLQYTTFDSGPGQIMLKERQFYDAMDAGAVPSATTMREEIAKLLEMLEDADRRLIRNRERGRTRIRAHLDEYDGVGGHVVDQSLLQLR
jgi:hypothetical protein